MVDFFEDWLKEVLFFFYVGLDVFGFWLDVMRCIRGGLVNFKRWGVLFICLVLCVIYVEFVEEVSLVLFINCLRWFIVLWGFV